MRENPACGDFGAAGGPLGLNIRGGPCHAKTDTRPDYGADFSVGDGGRAVMFPVNGATHTAEVSSGRTAVSIAGQKAERAALKPGMDCEITYPGDKQEAASITCK